MSCDACNVHIGLAATVQPHDALYGESTRIRSTGLVSQFRCRDCGNLLERIDGYETQARRFSCPPHTGANFHHYRYKSPRRTPYARLWNWHDNHPLPTPLNKAAREALYFARRLKQKIFTPKPKHGRDEYGDPVVPKCDYCAPVQLFASVPLASVEARFRQIHLANEHLYNGNGSWDPHPLMPLYGSGIPIEEVSERVLGYLAAFEAFGDPIFLRRAEEGGRYLLERRVFANGHLRLEAHLVIEVEYPYAGCALLALWERDRSQTEYLNAATKIADRLVEEHIGGAIDHAVKVAQLLAPLHRITGNDKYLKASLRRSFRAVALQLPYGGWPGQDCRMSYHCIIGRGLIDTYIATPNTIAYCAKKDRLARCITAAVNRIALAQAEDGSVKFGRGDGSKDPAFAEQAEVLRRHTVQFNGHGFVPTSMEPCDFVSRDTIDFLTAAFEELAVQPAAIAGHGVAAILIRSSAIHRLEFETYAVGRYAQFLRRLARLNLETRRRVGAAPTSATTEPPACEGAPYSPRMKS